MSEERSLPFNVIISNALPDGKALVLPANWYALTMKGELTLDQCVIIENLDSQETE